MVFQRTESCSECFPDLYETAASHSSRSQGHRAGQIRAMPVWILLFPLHAFHKLSVICLKARILDLF